MIGRGRVGRSRLRLRQHREQLRRPQNHALEIPSALPYTKDQSIHTRERNTPMSELAMRLRDEIESLQASARIEQLHNICRRALNAARRSHDTEAETVAILGLAIAHRLRGDSYEAGVLADGARQYADKIYAGALLCDTWLEVGAYHRTLRLDYRPARNAYEYAFEIANANDYHRGMVNALCGLAECYNDYRDYARARDNAQQAIIRAGLSAEEDYPIAQAYIALARAYIGLEKHTEALDALRIAQDIAEDENYPLIHIMAAYHAGMLFANEASLMEEAETSLNAARQIAVHSQFIYGEFLTLYGLGRLYDRLHQHEQAREMCDSMVILAQDSSNHAYITVANMCMASSFYAQGIYHQAHQHFMHALHEAEQHNLGYLRASVFMWLAQTARARQNHDDAVNYARSALTAFTAEQDTRAVRHALSIMVNAMFRHWWHRLLMMLGVTRRDADDEST